MPDCLLQMFCPYGAINSMNPWASPGPIVPPHAAGNMEPHACVPKRTKACRHGKIPWYLSKHAHKGDIPIPG